MKRWIIVSFLVVILITAIIIVRVPHKGLSNMEALEALVKKAGASVVDGEIQFYAVLENRFQKMDELEQIVLDVAGLLNMNEGNLEKGEGETYRVIDVTGESDLGLWTHIVVQSNPGDGITLPPQTYLLVVCRDSSTKILAESVRKITVILKNYASNGQLSFYLTGELSGKKENNEMIKMAQAALAAVDAEIVEGIEDEELVSYTAYTPLVKKYLAVGGDRFNLNIAIRYDDYLDKTVVWAGFPLIHDPY